MKTINATRAARAVTNGRPDRRQNILDTSQRLFARLGYHAVTIRQIATEAGVPLALVGYYFGQKQELYDAIFGQLSDTLEERRAGLYAAVNDHSGDPLAKIVEAMVVPTIEQRSTPQGEAFALFVSRGLTQQNEEADRSIREYFDPLTSEFIEVMHSVLAVEEPLITHAQATWCFQFALGALLHFLTDQRVARLSKGVNVPADPSVVPQLQAFIVNGIRGAVRSFVALSTASTAVTV